LELGVWKSGSLEVESLKFKEVRYLSNLLAGFEYNSIADFGNSLLPTLKYNMLSLMLLFTFPVAMIDKIFGLDYMAVLALLLVMVAELVSGIYASHITKQAFSSKRLSRFSFKTACYLILIAVPFLFYSSYKERNSLAASIFEWLHVFMVVQIVLENVFSILENIAIIQGKDKTYWIDKIKNKIGGML
jgi:hypothetical protein